MSDPTNRLDNWLDRMSMAAFKAPVITDAKFARMSERMGLRTSSLCQAEDGARQVLNAEGVATILYPAYINYARELWRLATKGVSGTSMQLEALVLLNKWVARGLTQSVLEAIRVQVMNIVAPT